MTKTATRDLAAFLRRQDVPVWRKILELLRAEWPKREIEERLELDPTHKLVYQVERVWGDRSLRRRIARLYRSRRLTGRAICRELGLAPTTVQAALFIENVAPRTVQRERLVLSEPDLRAYRFRMKSAQDLGREYGRHSSTILAALRRQGETIHPLGRPRRSA